MKIEDYLNTLPQHIITGQDVHLGPKSIRTILDAINLGETDVFYHLGCGDAASIKIAINEYHVKKAVGIDINQLNINQAKKGITAQNVELICDDITNQEYHNKEQPPTAILFWFTEQTIIEKMVQKFQKLGDNCKIITILDPLLDFKPSKVKFPYIIHNTPLTKASSLQQQLSLIFKVKCIDFVAAWEHAELYTKAITDPTTATNTKIENDRFLTIMQALTIWINARNLGLTCEKEQIPESIKTYMTILDKFFGIEIEHLLDRPEK